MPDPEANRLNYRSTTDAASDDAAALHRSVRTWVVLCAVWAVGLVVWGLYLGVLGYLFLRLLT